MPLTGFVVQDLYLRGCWCIFSSCLLIYVHLQSCTATLKSEICGSKRKASASAKTGHRRHKPYKGSTEDINCKAWSTTWKPKCSGTLRSLQQLHEASCTCAVSAVPEVINRLAFTFFGVRNLCWWFKWLVSFSDSALLGSASTKHDLHVVSKLHTCTVSTAQYLQGV